MFFFVSSFGSLAQALVPTRSFHLKPSHDAIQGDSASESWPSSQGPSGACPSVLDGSSSTPDCQSATGLEATAATTATGNGGSEATAATTSKATTTTVAGECGSGKVAALRSGASEAVNESHSVLSDRGLL